MNHEQVTTSIQSLGFPIVLCAAMAWAMWQVLKWVRPKIDALLDTHIQFVKRVEGAVDRFGETLERINSSLSLMQSIHHDVGEIKRHVGIKEPRKDPGKE